MCLFFVPNGSSPYIRLRPGVYIKGSRTLEGSFVKLNLQTSILNSRLKMCLGSERKQKLVNEEFSGLPLLQIL